MMKIRPMTSTERSRAHRRRIQEQGRRIVQAELSPNGAARLDQLVKKHGSINNAIEYALQSVTEA